MREQYKGSGLKLKRAFILTNPLSIARKNFNRFWSGGKTPAFQRLASVPAMSLKRLHRGSFWRFSRRNAALRNVRKTALSVYNRKMKLLTVLVQILFPLIYGALVLGFLLLLFSPQNDGMRHLAAIAGPALAFEQLFSALLASPMILLFKVISHFLPGPLQAWFPVTPFRLPFESIGDALAAVPLGFIAKAGNAISSYDYDGTFGGGFHWSYLAAMGLWLQIERLIEHFFNSIARAMDSDDAQRRTERLSRSFTGNAPSSQKTASVKTGPAPRQTEFRELVDSLKGEVTDLKSRVKQDPLTHLYNKAYFHAALEKEIQLLRSMQGDLALILLDIDDFKKVNDTYGHPQGDEILMAVAEELLKIRPPRGSAICCRIGGEELAVIFSGVPSAMAQRLTEALRQDIERLQFSHPSHPQGAIRVTASFGLVTITFSNSTESVLLRAQDVIQRADEHLYRAKQQGKNRVCVMNVE